MRDRNGNDCSHLIYCIVIICLVLLCTFGCISDTTPSNLIEALRARYGKLSSRARVHGITYYYGWSEVGSSDGTRYIEVELITYDESFSDDEGIKVGTTYKELMEKGYTLQPYKANERQGVILKSGWAAFFYHRMKGPDNGLGEYPKVRIQDTVSEFQYIKVYPQ